MIEVVHQKYEKVSHGNEKKAVKLVDTTNMSISEMFSYRIKELIPTFDEDDGKRELYVCGVLCSCGCYSHREYFLLFRNELEKVKNKTGDCIELFEEVVDVLDGLDCKLRSTFLSDQDVTTIIKYNNTLRTRHNELIIELSSIPRPECSKLLTKKIMFFLNTLFFSSAISYIYYANGRDNLLILSTIFAYIEICLLKLLSENIITVLSNEWSLDKVEIDLFFDYINILFKERNSINDSDRVCGKKQSWFIVMCFIFVFVIIPACVFAGSILIVTKVL
jgi:hypothetical protein